MDILFIDIIRYEIFNFLYFYDIVMLSQCCKQIRGIIEKSKIWSYNSKYQDLINKVNCRIIAEIVVNSYSYNKPLILYKNSDNVTMQALRDIDWEYIDYSFEEEICVELLLNKKSVLKKMIILDSSASYSDNVMFLSFILFYPQLLFPYVRIKKELFYELLLRA